jgi:hypothetical protein
MVGAEGQVIHKVVVLLAPASLTLCRNPFHIPFANRIYPGLDELEPYRYMKDRPSHPTPIPPDQPHYRNIVFTL